MSRSLFARLSRRFGPVVTSEERRAMLKATLLASAGLLISGPTAAARMLRAAAGGKRVVVVGGGFAGLACAHELASAGYDVTVIEARNRVGGRVLSFSDLVPGCNVEGGGELIGSNHPTWVAYKEKFGLEFLDVTEAEDVEFPIVLGDQRLSNEEAEGLYEEMDAALTLMNQEAASIDEDEPWKSPGAAELDARSTREWIRSLPCGALCKMGLTTQFVSDNGAAVQAQSYLGNLVQVKGGGLEKYWTETEVYRCKGGNQQLAMKLADAIGKERFVLGLAARSIAAKGGLMTVTCTDGRALECDDVVLAVPPSVWKKIEFNPMLPNTLSPQMGCNVKYLSALKSRFWLEKGLGPDALTDGDVGMTWDGTDGQEGAGGACLVAFSGGPAAEACRGRDGEKRKAAYAAAIEDLYPGYAAQCTGARFMDWPGDQWTMAGYSFPAPGQVCQMGPILRRGLGRLHFAGEHACYKFVGYMEGALNSGASLAMRLAERDGVTRSG